MPSQRFNTKKDMADSGNDRRMSFVAHAGKVLLKIVASRISAYCKASELLPEEQCGLHPHRLTTNMMLAIRRVEE